MLSGKALTGPGGPAAGIKARRRRKTSKEERICAVCGQAFKKAEHLARHLRSHTKEKPFNCSVCNKAFARQDTLLRHSRSHTTGDEDSEIFFTSIEPENHGCLDRNLMSQISIATGVPTIPIHTDVTDNMISPPSSTSIDKQTPDVSMSENSYPSQVTPLTSFFSLEADDVWRDQNQGGLPPPLWDTCLDQEWETLLTGDDFDLNAVNMSLLCATSPYVPSANLGFDLDKATSNPSQINDQAEQNSNMVQRKWHTFSEISSSGQRTPEVSHEGTTCTSIDETYRKRLADRLQQRVQTGILPSTPFLDLCIQAYFSKFHPLFPVVHMATFRPGTQNSILLLSICSVGSLFVGSSRAVKHGISMFERLHKAILASWDTYTFKSGGSSLVALQASIIGQSFGLLLGRPKDLTGIEVFHGSIIAWARKAKLFNLKSTEYHFLDTDGPSLEEAWNSWIQTEVKQRIILGLHIHDALFARIHHHEPILRHSIDRLPQISPNDLFTASSAENWKIKLTEHILQRQSNPLNDLETQGPFSNRARYPNEFSLNAILESISAIAHEDQNLNHHSTHQIWAKTLQKCHTLLKSFYTTYSTTPNILLPTSTGKSNHSWSLSSWPCVMMLWHSIFITLHTDINALECACGREGYDLAQPHLTYARSWIHSIDAKRSALHAMLLQRNFESLPAGAEPAIHVPVSLYYCGIVWACFMLFCEQGQNAEGDGLAGTEAISLILTVEDTEHFDELRLPGVDGVDVLLGQLGRVSLRRLAMGSLFRIIDLLQRINHFKISQSLALTLLAIVEETQGLF